MKYFRLTHILFLFVAVVLAALFLLPSVNAQSPTEVTPQFNCLGPCPTLPVKQSQSQPAQANQPSVAISPSPATTDPSADLGAIAANTEPCGDPAMSTVTPQSPFVAPDQHRSHGSRDRDKNDRHKEDRGGFLNDLFQLLLVFLEILIKAVGGNGLPPPCTPTPTPTPVATISSPPASPAPTGTSGVSSHASANWAGYSINTPPSQGGYITTNWPITNMPCVEQQKGHASSWPGMGGGKNDSNIAQLGTAEVCQIKAGRFAPVYYGWTERYPDPVAPLDATTHSVAVGDQLTATITFQGQGKFATIMTNKTKGWTVNMPMAFDASYVPQSSEIITESSDNFAIVPKFDTITYPGSFYSPDGKQKLPLGQAPKLERIVNKNAQGVLRTDTSPITGDSFFNNWTHN